MNRFLHTKRTTPKLLKESAGEKSCSIFRISTKLRRNNTSNAYDPDLVSIGPYHHGKKQYQMIEEHKPRFLHQFLEEAGKNSVSFEELVKSVSEIEEVLRSSYSENLVDLNREKLIDIMLLDGCFILMLFFIISRKVDPSGKGDPIFRIPWILSTIRSDLLVLENQVPLLLLETLFVTSRISPAGGLNNMAFKFFSYSAQLPKRSRIDDNIVAKHLLDLIRQTFIPEPSNKEKTTHHISLYIPNFLRKESESEMFDSDSDNFHRMITSARRLRMKGIVLKPRVKAKTWLDIKLKKDVLEIPPIDLDDFIGKVFLNFVAFEQFYGYHCSNHITSYIAFMGCLLSDEADTKFLIKQGILDVSLETSQDVSRFFKLLGKDAAFDISTSYLADVFQEVNKYTSKWYLVRYKELKHTFFGSSWKLVASFAAMFLLLLTFIQTYFTVSGYIRKN